MVLRPGGPHRRAWRAGHRGSGARGAADRGRAVRLGQVVLAASRADPVAPGLLRAQISALHPGCHAPSRAGPSAGHADPGRAGPGGVLRTSRQRDRGGAASDPTASRVLSGRHHRARRLRRSDWPGPDRRAWLIVVDQFEEVFTACRDEAEQHRLHHGHLRARRAGRRGARPAGRFLRSRAAVPGAGPGTPGTAGRGGADDPARGAPGHHRACPHGPAWWTTAWSSCCYGISHRAGPRAARRAPGTRPERCRCSPTPCSPPGARNHGGADGGGLPGQRRDPGRDRADRRGRL